MESFLVLGVMDESNNIGYMTFFFFLFLLLSIALFVVKINYLSKIKEERKKSNTQIKNTRIYVVRQYAYIHRRRQGESFTKKIGRLQQWYQDFLKEPKPQLHPNLSLTKNKPREKNPSLIILYCGTQFH